jgi:hypothetical protein
MAYRFVIRIVGIALLVLALQAGLSSGEDLLRNEQGQPSLERWQAFHDPPVEDVSEVWQLDDGVLSCKGLPRGYLYTKAAYEDFQLQLEWRWPPESKPGKGGVLFRKSGDNRVWPKSLESQLNVGDEGDFVGLVGYSLSGPAERSQVMEHPQFGKLTFIRKAEATAKPAGQWNELEITAQGGTVTMRMNGQTVNRATECDVVAGPILLTAENDPIQFRNIRVKVLDE